MNASESACAPGTHGQPDRRKVERWLCPNRIRVAIVTLGAEYDAVIYEVSEMGLGLIATNSVVPGTHLGIQHREEPSKRDVISATARHATPLRDGSWLIGCELEQRLSDECLALFLAENNEQTEPEGS